jgi:hypothetical protein
MVFNGHREDYIETLDEELFTEIQVMYADGLLGNKAIFDALTPITAGVFNYLRSEKTPAIKGDQVFPWVHEYTVNPDTIPTKEEQANQGLLLFLSQSPGFDPERFKK